MQYNMKENAFKRCVCALVDWEGECWRGLCVCEPERSQRAQRGKWENGICVTQKYSQMYSHSVCVWPQFLIYAILYEFVMVWWEIYIYIYMFAICCWLVECICMAVGECDWAERSVANTTKTRWARMKVSEESGWVGEKKLRLLWIYRAQQYVNSNRLQPG